MQVRLIYRLDGTRNGQPWPAVGGIIDVPMSEAINLISHGYAVPVPVPQEQERASIEQEPERATLPKTTSKPRKGRN
jgi:hypothetical protein